MPIERLVARVRDGIDVEESFRQIYYRYFRLVRRFFTHRGVRLDQAEDLTQETFANVYAGLAEFRGETSFENWLFRIAKNVDRKRRRRGRTLKRAALEVSLDTQALPEAEAHGAADPSADPLRLAIEVEQRRALIEALAGFPEQMRRCASLRFLQGLRYGEIAEALKISLDTVRVQLSRARKRLRKELAEGHGDSPI